MTIQTQRPRPLSPCERRCALDAEKTRCITCLRTRDEITSWGRMDDAQRRAVMDELPARRQALDEAPQ